MKKRSIGFCHILYKKQSVNIKNTISDPAPVKCGMPQGSILGPLLFVVFINNISLEEQLSDICLFADDAVIGRSGLNKNEIKNKLQPCGNSKYKSFLVSKRQIPYLYPVNINTIHKPPASPLVQ